MHGWLRIFSVQASTSQAKMFSFKSGSDYYYDADQSSGVESNVSTSRAPIKRSFRAMRPMNTDRDREDDEDRKFRSRLPYTSPGFKSLMNCEERDAYSSDGNYMKDTKLARNILERPTVCSSSYHRLGGQSPIQRDTLVQQGRDADIRTRNERSYSKYSYRDQNAEMAGSEGTGYGTGDFQKLRDRRDRERENRRSSRQEYGKEYFRDELERRNREFMPRFQPGLEPSDSAWSRRSKRDRSSSGFGGRSHHSDRKRAHLQSH